MAIEQPTGYRIIPPRGPKYTAYTFFEREAQANRFRPAPFGHDILKDAFLLQLDIDKELIAHGELISIGAVRERRKQIVRGIRYTLDSYQEQIHDYPEIERGLQSLWQEALAHPEIGTTLRDRIPATNLRSYYNLIRRDVTDDETLIAILINHNRRFAERQRAFQERVPQLRQSFLDSMQAFATEAGLSSFDYQEATRRLNELQIDYIDEIPAQDILTGGFHTASMRAIHQVADDNSIGATLEMAQLDLNIHDDLEQDKGLRLVTGQLNSLTAGGYRPDTAQVLLSARATPEEEDRILFEHFSLALAGRRVKEVIPFEDGETRQANQRRIVHDRLGFAMHSSDGHRIFFGTLSNATNRLLVHRIMGTTPDRSPRSWDESSNDIFLLQRLLAPIQQHYEGNVEQLLFDAYLTDSLTPNDAATQLIHLLDAYYGPRFLARLDDHLQSLPVYGIDPNVTDEWLQGLKRKPRTRRWVIES